MFLVVFTLFASLTLRCQEIASQSFIFQNLNFSRFYLRHVRKAYKVFCRDFLKKFQVKTWGFVRIYSDLVLSFMFHVLSWNFFQIVSRKVFVKTIWPKKATCSLHLESSSRNHFHRCVKDISFETDFQSLRRIFQL